MPEIGFSEILLIFVLGLVVLGPERLPRVAAQVGRWIGRARSMARQFREQLEEEVTVEETRKKDKARAANPEPAAQPQTPTDPAQAGATNPSGASAEESHTPPWHDAATVPDNHGEQSPTAEDGATPRSPADAAESGSTQASADSSGQNVAASAASSAGAAGASPSGWTATGSHESDYTAAPEEVASNETGHMDLSHEAWPHAAPAPPPEVAQFFGDEFKSHAEQVAAVPRQPPADAENTQQQTPPGPDKASNERAT